MIVRGRPKIKAVRDRQALTRQSELKGRIMMLDASIFGCSDSLTRLLKDVYVLSRDGKCLNHKPDKSTLDFCRRRSSFNSAHDDQQAIYDGEQHIYDRIHTNLLGLLVRVDYSPRAG